MEKWKKNKAVKLLGFFFLIKLREIEEKEILNKFDNGTYNYINIIIEESSKEIYKINKEKKLNEPIFFFDSQIKNKRNITLLYLSLLKFKGIKQYMEYFNLNKEDIRKISFFIKYKKFNKGKYIFRYGDYSDKIYGILKGKVEERIIKYKDYYNKFSKEDLKEKNEEIKEKNNIPFIENFMSDLEEENEESDNNNYINKNNNIINRKKLKVEKKEQISKKIIKLSNNKKLKFDLIIFKKKKRKKKGNKIIKSIKKYQTPNEKLEGEKLDKFILDFEYFKSELKEENCFGENSIIFPSETQNSILCKNEVEMFYLEKKYIEKILLRKIIKSNFEKMNFIKTIIPFFKINSKLFNEIIPIFAKKKKVIYTPYDKIKYIYIIYKGECYYGNLNIKNNSKEEYLSLMHYIKKITFLGIGSICGLEISKGKKYYNYSLIVNQENTILFKINIDLFNKFCNNYLNKFEFLYDKRNNIYKNCCLNKSFVLKKNIFKKDLSDKNYFIDKSWSESKINKNLRKFNLDKIRINLSDLKKSNRRKEDNKKVNCNKFQSSFCLYQKNLKGKEKQNLFRIPNFKNNNSSLLNNNSSIIQTNDKSYSENQKNFTQIKNTNNKTINEDRKIIYRRVKNNKIYDYIKNKLIKNQINKSEIQYYNSGSFIIPLISK